MLHTHFDANAIKIKENYDIMTVSLPMYGSNEVIWTLLQVSGISFCGKIKFLE